MKAALLMGCCFFVFANRTIAQNEPYLFKRIEAKTGSYEDFGNLLVINDGYAAIGVATYSIGDNQWKLTYESVSEAGGSIIKETSVVDSASVSPGWYDGAFVQNDVITGCGGYEHWTGETNPFVYKMSIEGSVTMLKVLERDSFNVFSQGRLCQPAHFIFIGISREFGSHGDYYLVKTDTNGEVIWEHTYGTGLHDYGFSVDQSSDGGYFMFGISRGYGPSAGSRTQALLIKTDSNGNEQWRRHWGGPYDDCATNVVATSDGGAVACGCWSAEDNFAEKHAYIRKVDSAGTLVWDSIFPPWQLSDTIAFNSFLMCRVLANGNIVAAGTGTRTHPKEDYGYEVPTFVLFDENGKVLHSRLYTSFIGGWDSVSTSGTHSFAWFEDIKATSDGGFIAGGGYIPLEFDTGNQDMFIVKLDSVGCEYKNCYDTVTGLGELRNEDAKSFRAYPNPFSGIITFETDGVEGSQVIIMDVRGVIVSRVTVRKDERNVYFDGNRLSSGLYFAALQGPDGERQVVKMIKN